METKEHDSTAGKIYSDGVLAFNYLTFRLGRSITLMRKPFEQLSEDEARSWVKELYERLKKKQARERAYLDRRKARGVHTPTDDTYESDQQLEDDLLAILEQLAKE